VVLPSSSADRTLRMAAFPMAHARQRANMGMTGNAPSTTARQSSYRAQALKLLLIVTLSHTTAMDERVPALPPWWNGDND
jgi:hypothetical protein